MFKLLDMLKFYTGFEINDQTGNALTEKEMTTLHYERITSLQVTHLHIHTCVYEQHTPDNESKVCLYMSRELHLLISPS